MTVLAPSAKAVHARKRRHTRYRVVAVARHKCIVCARLRNTITRLACAVVTMTTGITTGTIHAIRAAVLRLCSVCVRICAGSGRLCGHGPGSPAGRCGDGRCVRYARVGLHVLVQLEAVSEGLQVPQHLLMARIPPPVSRFLLEPAHRGDVVHHRVHLGESTVSSQLEVDVASKCCITGAHCARPALRQAQSRLVRVHLQSQQKHKHAPA